MPTRGAANRSVFRWSGSSASRDDHHGHAVSGRPIARLRDVRSLGFGTRSASLEQPREPGVPSSVSVTSGSSAPDTEVGADVGHPTAMAARAEK
ncbi:hypothetical protein BRC90_06555 [Halobacteriales archaeon QS_4_69_34]|nr:MAG: hypothetical protein BRC90_06555 [Halobacteriales archaeon QS_4_69_34]